MKHLIVANWKLNPPTQKEAVELFDAVQKGIEGVKNVKVVICPPLVYVSIFKFHVSGIALGAQNVFYKEKGAFTGEVSPAQLRDLGVEYVIVGHSEARKYLNETDQVINKKIKECLQEGLKPILCVGEIEGENKEEVLERQIKESLREIINFKLEILNFIVAYEPVWAIGTGKNCSVEETLNSVLFIRKTISGLYNKEISEKVRVLYGGSVNSKNSADYLKNGGVGGLLVGSDSLNPEDFIKIVKSIEIKN